MPFLASTNNQYYIQLLKLYGPHMYTLMYALPTKWYTQAIYLNLLQIEPCHNLWYNRYKSRSFQFCSQA